MQDLNLIRDRLTTGSVKLSQNLFVNTTNYSIEAFIFNTKSLVVTFEAFSATKDTNDFRMGWGGAFLRQASISHLCIKPKSPDWYRGADLGLALADLKQAGFFTAFDRVMTYGGSMGGYGALAYADSVGAHVAFALNPQSTLAPKQVPWETRFPEGRVQDWDGAFAEAREGMKNLHTAYVAADMRHAMDAKHVERLQQENLCVLNVPFVGHFMPAHLRNMGMLQETFFHILQDRFDIDHFRKRARARRRLPAYFEQLLERPRVRDSDYLRRIVSQHSPKPHPASA